MDKALVLELRLNVRGSNDIERRAAQMLCKILSQSGWCGTMTNVTWLVQLACINCHILHAIAFIAPWRGEPVVRMLRGTHLLLRHSEVSLALFLDIISIFYEA